MATHTRMQRAEAKVRTEERQRDREREKERCRIKKASSARFKELVLVSKWTYPSLPCCFATFWKAPPVR